MATKWFQGSGEKRKIKEVRCNACGDGKHDRCQRQYVECKCFCHRTASVATARTRSVWPYRNDIEAVLARLRDAGVECRGTRSWKLVWRPKPSEMEPWLRMAVRNHELDLVHILFPHTQRRVEHRDFWTAGPIDACFDCGESCAKYDPLGQCRHSWCGWLSIRREPGE